MLGHGQVDNSRSGENRSNFNVGILDKNWCLADSVFDYEFIDAMFILVGGPQPPLKNGLKNWCMLC